MPKPAPSVPETVDPEDVVSINSNLVTVPATVVDAAGKVVTDLKLEDFELRVDGQPKPIGDLGHSETPVRMALLFDNSSSLTTAREFEKQAATKFFRSVIRPSVDEAAVYSISTVPTLEQGLTFDVRALVRTIERFGKPEGATALFDTVAQAAAYLKPYTNARKVIVIVSDGADTISDLDFDSTLQRVQGADVQIYAVQTGHIENANLRDLAAERRLQDFTAQTGGEVYVPRDTADLDSAFARISADLAQQYVLSYYPTDDRQDGRYRTLSVRIVTRPGLRVRARRGYYDLKEQKRRAAREMSYPQQNAPQTTLARLEQQETIAPKEIPAQTPAPRNSVSVSSITSRTPGPQDTEAPVSNLPQPSSSAPNGSSARRVDATGKFAAVKSETSDTPPQPEPTPTPPSSTPPPNATATPTPSPVTRPSPPTSTASPTPKPTPTPSTESSSSSSRVAPEKVVISGGVLNGKALSLPKPDYPPMARSLNIHGVVVVEVVVDETGKVISARALSGEKLLQQPSVAAARRARFSPTILSGKPVQVRGVINYNFTP